MTNYTTPSLSFEVEGIDLTTYKTIVSLEQDDVQLKKSGNDLTLSYDPETNVTAITVVLSQEESAAFNYGRSVYLQVNFINAAEVRDATEIAKIPVMRNLLDEVVHYVDQA